LLLEAHLSNWIAHESIETGRDEQQIGLEFLQNGEGASNRLPTLTRSRAPPPTGLRGDVSAPRRLDENQLPPVQHLRDRTSLLDLCVRVANRVVQGLDVDAWDLHDVPDVFPFSRCTYHRHPGSAR